jgi:hypothetical protein
MVSFLESAMERKKIRDKEKKIKMEKDFFLNINHPIHLI